MKYRLHWHIYSIKVFFSCPKPRNLYFFLWIKMNLSSFIKRAIVQTDQYYIMCIVCMQEVLCFDLQQKKQ